MRTKTLLSILFMILLTLIMSFKETDYSTFYYAYEEKIPLSSHLTKIIVRYINNKESNIDKISLSAELKDKLIEWKDDSTCIFSIPQNEQQYYYSKLTAELDVKVCNPIYTISSGLEMGVTDEFVVMYKDKISNQEIMDLTNKYNVKTIKSNVFYKLCVVPKGSDVLKIANLFQESGLTIFSHPNFIVEKEWHQVIPNDPYFVNQFSLNNTGQVFTDGHSGLADADIDAPEAWTVSKGNNNIVIAVLDQGVTSDHPDLPNTRQIRLNGSNFGDGDPNNPSPTLDNNHGNACAGIIAATQNNNIGISGIASNCRIMPIRTQNAGAEATAAAILFASQNGAHILSCSWGYNSTNPNFLPVIRTAIENVASNGRNYLGCIVVFSASNTADHIHGSNGQIRFPSNVDVPGVLTVGASDRNDSQANYSPTSDPSSPNNQIIDIVAPSNRAYSWQITGETYEAWTIDIPENPGYNPVHETDGGALPTIGSQLPNSGSNYLSFTGRMGGTSFSCPQVAGVAALILSINPNLSKMEVFNILTSTADHVGGYVYTNGRCNELGDGRLNACRAVTQAVVSLLPLISGSPLVCSTGGQYSIGPLPSGCPIVWETGPYLSRISNQGSNPCSFASTGNGDSWIRCSINAGCGSIVLYTLPLYSGKPYITNQKVDGSTYYSGMQICPGNHWLSVTPYGYGAGIASWTVPAGVPYFVGNNTLDFTLPSNLSSISISVKSTNACGTGPNSYFYLVKKTYGCTLSLSMLLYPNPASDNVTVTFIESQPLIEDNDSILDNVVLKEVEQLEPTNYTINIYNNQSLLISTLKRSGNSFIIPLANIPDGIYIIEVSDGINCYRQQLIVKHN